MSVVLLLVACTREPAEVEDPATAVPAPVTSSPSPTGTPPPAGTTPPPSPDRDFDGVGNDLDCADDDPASFPGHPEVPCDGRDNDCVGGDDRADCVIPLDSADFVVPRPDTAEEGWWGIAVVPDLTGDGVNDLWIASTVPGVIARVHSFTSADPLIPVIEILDDGVVQWADFAFPGDVTGDTRPDLLIRDLVLPGPFSGAVPPTSTLRIGSSQASENRAALTGDWDGDGALEILTYGGKLVWSAPPLDGSGPSSIAEAEPEVSDDDGNWPSVAVLATGDLDADGADDFLASWTPGGTNVYEDDGRMHVFSGVPGPDATWATATASFALSLSPYWRTADLDADGHLDVAAFTSAALEVAYGPIALAGDLALADLSGSHMSTGTDPAGLELIPDVEGDGFPNMLLGCESVVILGALAVRGNVESACTAGREIPLAAFPGSIERWFTGGDLDGDGLGDVVVTDADAAVYRVWFGSSL